MNSKWSWAVALAYMLILQIGSSGITNLVHAEKKNSEAELEINTITESYQSDEISALHASGVSLSASTSTPSTIDGSIQDSEWADADTLGFVTAQGKFSGTVYVMNDASNLYIAIKITDSSIAGRRLDIIFDNNHNGVLQVGEDYLIRRQDTNVDFHVIEVTSTSIRSRSDALDGGTNDGSVEVTNDGTFNHFEFVHPLCSSDSFDFCLSANDIVGFEIVYFTSATTVPSDVWPAALRVPISDASRWGDITIHPLEFCPAGHKIEKVFLPKVRIPIEGFKYSILSKLNLPLPVSAEIIEELTLDYFELKGPVQGPPQIEGDPPIICRAVSSEGENFYSLETPLGNIRAAKNKGQAEITIYEDGTLRWRTARENGFEIRNLLPCIPTPPLTPAFCTLFKLPFDTGEYQFPKSEGERLPLSEIVTLNAPHGLSLADGIERIIKESEDYLHKAIAKELPSLVPDWRAKLGLFLIQDPGNVRLLVIDQNGLRTGILPDGSLVNEIPGSLYFPSEMNPAALVVGGEGSYRIVVTGIGSGTYTLSLSTIDPSLTMESIFEGQISPGVNLIFNAEIHGSQLIQAMPDPISELELLKKFINELSPSTFDNKADQRKKALSNKINEVIEDIHESDSEDAIEKLMHDIRPKMDGKPNPKDWIIDPVAQITLTTWINQIISHIDELLDEDDDNDNNDD